MAKRKYINEARLGAFILLVLVVFAYLALRIGRFNVGEDVVVDAVFDDAAGLVPEGPVMLAGVRIGTIVRLSVEHDKARVTFSVRSDAKVRNDVHGTIRMKSLLGEKFLEIIPQSEDAPFLKTGDTIAHTFVPVEFDQVVNRLAAIVERLDTTDPERGNTIDNVARLTAALRKIAEESGDSIPPAMRNIRDVTAELKETIAENKKGVKETLSEVHDLAATAHRILDNNETHINNIARNLDTTTAAFAGESGATAKNLNSLLKSLAAVAERLPKTLDKLEGISGKFEETLDRTNRLLAKLEELDERKIRKILMEDGITINLFRRNIDEVERDDEKRENKRKKHKEQEKERGFLFFGK